jgi:hypothetical protein
LLCGSAGSHVATVSPGTGSTHRRHVAWALNNRAFTLKDLGRREQSLIAYDELIERFRDEREPEIRQRVSWALWNKAGLRRIVLWTLPRDPTQDPPCGTWLRLVTSSVSTAKQVSLPSACGSRKSPQPGQGRCGRCALRFLIRGAAARGARRVNNLMPVSDEVQIEEVCEVFGGLVPAIDRLVKQLSKSAAPPTQAELDAIVDSHASRLLIRPPHAQPGTERDIPALVAIGSDPQTNQHSPTGPPSPEESEQTVPKTILMSEEIDVVEMINPATTSTAGPTARRAAQRTTSGRAPGGVRPAVAPDAARRDPGLAIR